MYHLPECYDVTPIETLLRRVQKIDMHQHISQVLQQRTGSKEKHGDKHTRKVLTWLQRF